MTADWKMAWGRAALVGAVGLALLSVVLGSMLVVNYVQLKRVDPLNLPELVQKRTEYAGKQGDEALQQEIRALDLMARRAFFTTQHQLEVGAGALAGCVVGGVLLLLLAGLMSVPEPNVKGLPKERGGWERRGDVRAGVWLAGGVLMAVALAGWIATPPLMEVPKPEVASQHNAVKEPVVTGNAAVEIPFVSKDEWYSNWPGFRGPDGNGVARVKVAPTKWDVPKGEGVKWKVTLPLHGYSSPIAWGKRVFLTGADPQKRVIYALDADTGVVVWEAEVGSIPGAPVVVPEVTDDTGLAAATPVTDGRRVYAIFGTGELLCVDMEGKTIWKRFLGTPENHYGHSSSLVIDEKRLYVQMDDAAKPRVIALDKATGATVWEKPRRAISWATPMLVNRAGFRSQESEVRTDSGTGKKTGREELVLCDSVGVESYDPVSGESLWWLECLGGELAPSPGYGDGIMVVAGDNAKACGFRLRAGKPTLAWEWKDGLPDTASPLVFSNRVLLATSGGALVLLSADEGKLIWQQELSKNCYASPVLAAGNIYALDLGGVMHVIEARDEFKEVASCPFGEMAGATPAFVEGRIYLRGGKVLACVGE